MDAIVRNVCGADRAERLPYMALARLLISKISTIQFKLRDDCRILVFTYIRGSSEGFYWQQTSIMRDVVISLGKKVLICQSFHYAWCWYRFKHSQHPPYVGDVHEVGAGPIT